MTDIPRKIVEIQFENDIWVDVSEYLIKDLSTTRGSTRVESPVIRYEPGHAKVVLNNTDRRFDPTNLHGPYISVDTGKSQVTARRPLRISAEWRGTTYPVFTGYVDIWDIDWVADVYSHVTVNSTDGFKILKNTRRVGFEFPEYDRDLPGARANRILDSAGWGTFQRVIDTGNTPMPATYLSGSALDELQGVAESEIGELYMDALGRVVFRGRHALIQDARSNSTQFEFGTFVDQPAPVELKLNTDDATYWNEAKVTRLNGVSEQFYEDVPSKIEYHGSKTFERSGLWLRADSTAHGYASWIVFISRDPEVRFDAITIYPMKDPDVLFPQVLGREIGDRIRITRRPPGGGLPISREVFIRGISHQVGQASWKTTFILQSATDYGSFFTLNDSVLGVLGNGRPMVY